MYTQFRVHPTEPKLLEILRGATNKTDFSVDPSFVLCWKGEIGRWCYDLGYLATEVPAALSDWAIESVVIVSFGGATKAQAGLYQYDESWKAQVETHFEGGKSVHSIRVEALTLKEATAKYNGIVQGRIDPTEPWPEAFQPVVTVHARSGSGAGFREVKVELPGGRDQLIRALTRFLAENLNSISPADLERLKDGIRNARRVAENLGGSSWMARHPDFLEFRRQIDQVAANLGL